MSKLDYSRWDNIELSDDEDIECHPNVDKPSLIRWRQQKIHQEREERRIGIQKTGDQLVWLDEYIALLKHYPNPPNEIVKKVEMHLKRFEQIPEEILAENLTDSSQVTYNAFFQTVLQHRLSIQKEHDRLVAEDKQKLTIDNLCKPGFDSKTRINMSSTAPPPKKTTNEGSSTKRTEEVLEVLNPEGVLAGKERQIKEEAKLLRKSEDQFISSDAALVFANLPCGDHERSFNFLQDNSFLVNQEYSDMILASAFQCQMKRKSKRMKNYVYQALILQFASNLGKEGVSLFFSKITDPKHRATQLFKEDLARTTEHIIKRCQVLQAKEKGELQSVVDLTPSPEKMELLRDLPPHVQQALLTEDMEQIELALASQPDIEKEKILDKMKKVGILRPPAATLSEEEKLELFKQLPEDFSHALIHGHIEKVNELLAGYTPMETERIMDICKRGDFLDITEEDVVEEENVPTPNRGV